MNPTDPNQPQVDPMAGMPQAPAADPMAPQMPQAPVVDPMAPVDPMAQAPAMPEPAAPTVDPMAQAPAAMPQAEPAPVEPTAAPVEPVMSAPQPVVPPMGEQPMGGMPGNDQGGSVPPTAPPTA